MNQYSEFLLKRAAKENAFIDFSQWNFVNKKVENITCMNLANILETTG